jgi:ribonuclease R
MARGQDAAERTEGVAVVSKKGKFLTCSPIFERGGQFTISGGPKVSPDRMALVRWIRGDRAEVIRELGNPDVAADVVEALLADREVERGFSPEIEIAARDAARDALDAPGERKDLRDLTTFTVDPATARDFDDAVSAKREGDDIRLWIHIADVAAHIKPGTALEDEAYRRANSIYVPGSVEPMLPHALSSEACSLAPEVDRLAVTTEVLLSPDGEAKSTSFYRSIICSDVRLDYDQLDRIFAGKEKPPEIVAEPMKLARAAAAARLSRRPPDALEVSTSEPDFSFDSDGNVEAAKGSEQTESHTLIEMLMILTNEQVAEVLQAKRIPTLYRVHEEPDPSRVEQLCDQLAALDLPTPPVPKGMTPQQAGEVVGQASRLVSKEAKRRGHGLDAYTSLILRSLKPAYYSDQNLGHAGLASSAYSHFTSPIRRFPDLVCHRGILSVVYGEKGGERAPLPEEVADAGPHCSEIERDAVRIERDADSICASYLLQREVRERGPNATYEGEVSGVIEAGAFIRFAGEHSDVYEGFLPVRRIGSRERYNLDETGTQLVGSGGGRAVRFGDPVEITVDRVDAPRGRVDLLPAPGKDGESRQGSRRRGSGQRGRNAGTRSGGAPKRGGGRKSPTNGSKAGKKGGSAQKKRSKPKSAGNKTKNKGRPKPKAEKAARASRSTTRSGQKSKAKGASKRRGGAKKKGR